jgi:hypothetical protein
MKAIASSALLGVALLAPGLCSQVTWDDDQRAASLGGKYRGLVLFEAGPVHVDREDQPVRLSPLGGRRPWGR